MYSKYAPWGTVEVQREPGRKGTSAETPEISYCWRGGCCFRWKTTEADENLKTEKVKTALITAPSSNTEHLTSLIKHFLVLNNQNMQPWTSRCRRGRCRVPPAHPVEPIGRQLSCSPGRSPRTQRSAGGTADLSVTNVLEVKERKELFIAFTTCLLVQKTTAGMFLMLTLHWIWTLNGN